MNDNEDGPEIVAPHGYTKPHLQVISGHYYVPHGFEVWADGVYKRKRDPDLDEAPWEEPTLNSLPPNHQRKYLERLNHHPLWVTGLGHCIDTDERLVRLSYQAAVSGNYEHRWVDLAQVVDRRALVKLSAYGLPIDCENATEFILFLRKCEAANHTTLQRTMVAHRTGPHEVVQPDGSKVWGWLLGATWIGPGNVQYDPRAGDPLVDHLATHGDLDTWRDEWIKLRQRGYVERFVMGASFAAPLMRWVGRRTFFLHLWGISGFGKTAVAKFGLSVWGRPDKLMHSLNGTSNSTTEIFRSFTDLLVLYDEQQALKGDPVAARKSLIYDVCLEQGRERAKRDGGNQKPTPPWHTVACTTGEEALVTHTDRGGEANRVVQIRVGGNVIPSEAQKEKWSAEAEALHNFGLEHHGFAGPVFLTMLVGLVNSPDGEAKLRARFEQFRTLISARCTRRSDHIGHCALVALGQYLAEVSLLHLPANEAELQAVEDAVRVIEGLPHEYGMDIATRALDFLRDHRLQKRDAYLSYRDPDWKKKADQQRSLVGFELPEGTAYLRNAINTVLREANLAPERIWEDFSQRGWLVPGDGKHLAPKRTIGSVPQRVFIIRREVFEGQPQLALVPAVCAESPNTSVQYEIPICADEGDHDFALARATGAVVVPASGPALHLLPSVWGDEPSEE
jgi:hypothetical protein